MSQSKTDSKSTPTNTTTWWRLASFRSHAVGATACLFVCAAIIQVYGFNSQCETVEISSGVSVEEAIEVLRCANEWRSVHQEKTVLNEQLNARIDSLASWIPKTVNSDELEAEIESLTKTTARNSFQSRTKVLSSAVALALQFIRATCEEVFRQSLERSMG